MAEISATMVKTLREKSGVGMMDCKKALTENNGDIEASTDWLRTKGLSKAAKTADGEVVSDLITHLIATIGENMLLRRTARFSVAQGAIGAYVHGAVPGAADLGRIGVLVAVEGAGDQGVLRELGRNIALHAAATSPLSLSVDDLDPAAVERERAIFTEQSIASGKPPSVAEKMVEGRIRKFYEEAVLLKQAYVRDPAITIEGLVAQTAKQLGSPVKVVGFARLALGEGVEKEAGDFAAEVASMAGTNQGPAPADGTDPKVESASRLLDLYQPS